MVRMARPKWSDLDRRVRGLIIAAAVLEGCLKAAALADIARRPSSAIRGRKLVWVPILILVNSVGAAPVAYFVFGRRRG